MQKISKYRTEMLGIAAIGVLLIHSLDYGVPYNAVFKFIAHLGVYGVDVFLLLSGIGLVVSAEKNNISQFYRNRFHRVAIPYLLMAIPFFFWKMIYSNTSFITFLLDISTLNYWIRGNGAWYVAMLIPLYLIFPHIYKVTKRCGVFQNYVWIITAVLLSYSMIVWDNIGGVPNVRFVMVRLPAFLIGCYMGRMLLENRTIQKWHILIAVLLFVVTYKTNSILLWSANSWAALVAVILLPTVLKKCAICISKSLKLIGTYSLEMYLSNIFLINIFTIHIHKIISNQIIEYILIVLFGSLWCMTTKWLSRKIVGIW